MKVTRPIPFQGRLSAKAYFEGWYYKLISPQHHAIYAIIPGIALDKKCGTSHAFIQILEGFNADYHYLQFPITEFSARRDKFEVKIGANFFTKGRLVLNIDRPEIQVQGSLQFVGGTPFPRRWWRPNVMGPFSFLPFMETYHALIDLNASIKGSLEIDGLPTDFTGGKVYIEKDYGKSFPKNWIWAQSNHFPDPTTGFFFSLARIPYLGQEFPGFLAVFTHQGQTHVFATYSGAKITDLRISEDIVEGVIHSRKYRLIFRGVKDPTRRPVKTAVMKAPVEGQMTSKCLEAMTATLHVNLAAKTKKLKVHGDRWEEIYSGTGHWAGLEIMATNDTFGRFSRRTIRSARLPADHIEPAGPQQSPNSGQVAHKP